MRRTTRLATALVALAALAACGGTQHTSGSGDVEVLASFYPLQYVAQQVGGEHVSVTNLTPPGADPHSLEIAPATVQQLADAELVVYLSGLQPAVDDAIAVADPAHALDTAAAADLAGADPHFWLDPLRLATVGQLVADELAEVDEDNAQDYRDAADELEAELADLDAEYRERLGPCAGATLVTSHEAFGYLASRYDLEQIGIAGIDPDSEPSPARLREVGAVVAERDVHTVYFDAITSPQVAQTLADELGVATDLLDPIEGQVDPEADYIDVMRANLDALADGLAC